jgi:hypothetical protein
MMTGLEDEEVILKALTDANGDVEQAIETIFSEMPDFEDAANQ